MNATEQKARRTAVTTLQAQLDDLALVVEAMDSQVAALADAMKQADLLCVDAIKEEGVARFEHVERLRLELLEEGAKRREQIAALQSLTLRRKTRWQRLRWLLIGH